MYYTYIRSEKSRRKLEMTCVKSFVNSNILHSHRTGSGNSCNTTTKKLLFCENNYTIVLESVHFYMTLNDRFNILHMYSSTSIRKSATYPNIKRKCMKVSIIFLFEASSIIIHYIMH